MKIDNKHQLGCSQEEFFRILPKALKKLSYTIDKNNIFVNYKEGDIRIEIGAEMKRHLGSLCIPVLDVMFSFRKIPIVEQKQFLTNFMKSYQRGGG